MSYAYGISYSSSGLKIELAESVEEAIDSGIALTFECDFAHIERFLFVSWPEQLKRHRFVVSRHALSNRYLVKHDSRVAPRIFRAKREAMAFIQEQSMALFLKYHARNLHNNEAHEMRLYLSKTELPGPLRLSAFISKEWDLDSGWVKWQSAR